MLLELKPYIWSHSEAEMSDRKPFAFEVTHILLPGYDIRISEMARGRWQTLETIDGVVGEWTGEYDSAEEALQAIQDRFLHRIH
jgi:hypothetical protein